MPDDIAIGKKKKKIKLDFFSEGLEVGREKHLNFFIVADDDNKDRSSVINLAALIFLPSLIFIPYQGISSRGARTGSTRRIYTHRLQCQRARGSPALNDCNDTTHPPLRIFTSQGKQDSTHNHFYLSACHSWRKGKTLQSSVRAAETPCSRPRPSIQ